MNTSMFGSSLAAPPLAGSSRPLAEGDAGTIDTVREMCRLIDEGAKDPEINRAAVAIVRQAGVPQFCFEGERQAVYRWVRRAIRFFRDIDGKETLRSARETLHSGGGDCDCQTILMCALLKTIGQRVRIITISSHPQAPDLFSHVFAEVRDERGRWIPVDTARRSPRYGLGPQNWFRRWAWDTDDGSFTDADAPQAQQGGGRFFAGLEGLGAHQVSWRSYSRQRGLRGLGFNPRRRYLRGLGQDSDTSFDWSQLETELPSILTSTAGVVAAARANPINLTAPGAPTQLTPAAQALLMQQGLSTSAIPTWMWLAGGGLLLFFAMRGR